MSENYPIPADEPERLAVVRDLTLIGTPADEFLRIFLEGVQLTMGVPTVTASALSVEHQWFMGHIGTDICQSDRSQALCNYTITTEEPVFEICDALKIEQFAKNDFVNGNLSRIRYYCGAPIICNSHKVGALCLIDQNPREPLPAPNRMALVKFAAVLGKYLEMRQIAKKTLVALSQAIKWED